MTDKEFQSFIDADILIKEAVEKVRIEYLKERRKSKLLDFIENYKELSNKSKL